MQSKARLKFVIVMHVLLFFVMLIKLSDDLLDRMDIFILELQELYIPKPRLWEWVWAGSVVSAWTGLKSIKKNNVSLMKIYAFLIGSFSFLPIFYELIYWFPDFKDFASGGGEAGTSSPVNPAAAVDEEPLRVIEKWRGYPIGFIWYPFLVIALQVHLFQLYFASVLIRVWSSRTRKTE